MTLHAPFTRLIDAFRPAEGPPPQTLARFIGWSLSGAGRGLTVATLASVAAGVVDVASATLLGAVIDGVTSAPPGQVWSANWPILLGFILFFLAMVLFRTRTEIRRRRLQALINRERLA